MVTSPYDDGGSVRPPHPDIDELADLAAGVSDDAQVRAHVETCSECRQLLTDITAASAAVAMELAALPSPPMPPGLVSRIDAAIAAERSAASPDETPTVPTETTTSAPIEPTTTAAPSGNVVPIADRQSFWRRHGGAVASTAAAAVIIAFASVLAIGHFRDDKPSTDTTASAPKANTSIVTASGINYNTRNLAASLSSLLAHKPPGGASELAVTPGGAAAQGTTGDSAASGGATGSSAPSVSSDAKRLSSQFSQVQSLPANLTALKTDPLALQQCLVNLEVPPATPPLAIDLGLWNGSPAAVFVFAVETRKDLVAVLIAPAGCPPGEVLAYQRFAKPTP